MFFGSPLLVSAVIMLSSLLLRVLAPDQFTSFETKNCTEVTDDIVYNGYGIRLTINKFNS